MLDLLLLLVAEDAGRCDRAAAGHEALSRGEQHLRLADAHRVVEGHPLRWLLLAHAVVDCAFLELLGARHLILRERRVHWLRLLPADRRVHEGVAAASVSSLRPSRVLRARRKVRDSHRSVALLLAILRAKMLLTFLLHSLDIVCLLWPLSWLICAARIFYADRLPDWMFMAVERESCCGGG